MKKITTIISIIIVLLGSYFLLQNWHSFREIINKITKSQFERFLEQDNLRIQQEPGNPWAYIDRGNTYKKNKHYTEALNDYLKAYQLNNTFSAFVFDDISNIYLAMGNTNEAYNYINKLIKKAPYPENYFYDLAIIYDFEWKSKDALLMYTEFIAKTNKTDFEHKQAFSLKRRAVHYILLKEYDKARADVESFLRIKPNDGDGKALQVILSDVTNFQDEIFRKKFQLNVFEAIVGINK